LILPGGSPQDPEQVARTKTLTQEALLQLGPERLARLVLEEAGKNPGFKRIVTAALASTRGPEAIAAVIDRRLAALERAKAPIAWEKRKAFMADLDATRTTITDELAAADPALASERLIRLLATAEGVFERVDDSSGHIQEVYRSVADAFPALVEQLSEADRARLPNRLLPLVLTDGYGLMEQVTHALVPLLSPAARARFDAALAAAAQETGSSRTERHRWEQQLRRDRIIRARQALADTRGDVDAYIALESERESALQNSLAIAERLLAAGRPAEALTWVRRPPRPGLRVMSWQDLADATGGHDHTEITRIQLEVRILEATGDREAAQALRWQTFEQTLNETMLRDYLAHLPDFAEFETLDRAFAHASTHPHRYVALAFFLAWPRLDLAAQLVQENGTAWDGRHYGALVPAAAALEEGYPAAATILYRTLIDDILSRARSPAYGHAARYLAKLDALAGQIGTGSKLSDHQSYRAALQQKHGRKAAFWSLVGV
jgi:hypothetical protein